jgi:hypothetical protein
MMSKQLECSQFVWPTATGGSLHLTAWLFETNGAFALLSGKTVWFFVHDFILSG